MTDIYLTISLVYEQFKFHSGTEGGFVDWWLFEHCLCVLRECLEKKMIHEIWGSGCGDYENYFLLGLDFFMISVIRSLHDHPL